MNRKIQKILDVTNNITDLYVRTYKISNYLDRMVYNGELYNFRITKDKGWITIFYTNNEGTQIINDIIGQRKVKLGRILNK